MRQLDLTPFGFTPTESLAYGALLTGGPSSGYAVAKHLAIARANAYQALNGLVAKRAATVSEGPPQQYRAVSPPALLALVTRRRAEELDALQAAVAAAGPAGAPATVAFEGERAFRDLTLRTAALTPGPVTAVAPTGVLSASLPVWRKRAADGSPTALWSVGPEPADLPVPLAGVVEESSIREHFGHPTALVLTPDAGLVARVDTEFSGFWCSHPALLGTIRAAIAALTEPPGS